MTDKTPSPSELLANEFLENAKKFNADVELIKVLKSRTYKIGDSNVLVRAASKGKKSYFFGINYLTIEEINNTWDSTTVKAHFGEPFLFF